jgi:hypothetical protein
MRHLAHRARAADRRSSPYPSCQESRRLCGRRVHSQPEPRSTSLVLCVALSRPDGCSGWLYHCTRRSELNERLRRGGSKRHGLEAPKYSVVGSQESVPEKAILMLLRPNMIDALTLAGLALRPSGPLSPHATRLWDDTLQPTVHPAPDVSIVCGTPRSFRQ